MDVLGTDAHVDFLADVVLIRELGQLAGRDDDLVVSEDGGHVVAFLDQLDGEEVHLRAADEAGDEQVGGIVVQVLGSIDLLHKAVLHNHDAGRHGHGLGLVVGHVDEGGLQALMQLGDLGTHGNAQLGVQVGQRLVEEEDLRLTDNGTAQSNALALAAGQSLGLAVE